MTAPSSDARVRAAADKVIRTRRRLLQRLAQAPAPRMGMTPPHPGTFVRTEILDPLDLTVTAAARVLGVSRPALSNLLNGQADLSGDMAVRIEKAFGVRMETLLRMQTSFDIAQARRRAPAIRVRRYRRP